MELIRAVQNDDIDRVSELLDSGVDPNLSNRWGFTPIIEASRYGNTEIAELLLENGVNPIFIDKMGHTPLTMASRFGNIEIVKLLLLEYDVDPDIKDYDVGNTSLIVASREGHSDIVELLLELDANPNKKTTIEGDTPLIAALEEGYSDIVKLLLENGADPTIRNNKGISAYDLALNNIHIETARLIIEYMDLQRAQQNLAFMKYFLDRDDLDDDLDIDAASKIFSIVRNYNPSVSRRIRDENRMMENDRIADYLNTIEQYGMGKHGKKHGKKRSGKKKSKTKRKNNYYIKKKMTL